VIDSLLGALGHAWWAYPLLLAFCAFDAVVPMIPSETALITGGILSADGAMVLWGVIAMASIGSFLGDNLAYWIGRSAQDWTCRWITRGEKGRRGLAWAQRELNEHGGSIIIVARFIPGGRTPTMIACGVLQIPYRQFLAFDAVAAVLWGSINTLIGFIGGKAFADNAIGAFAVSFGVAAVVAGTVEVVRRVRRKKQPAEQR
jgi:membrane protein DedA with SNARE-associated domain